MPDSRLLTPEQLAETKKRLDAFHVATEDGPTARGRKLLDHIAALDQQRAEALLIAKTLRHEMGCASSLSYCPCGTDACAVKSGKPCNCSRGLLIEKLGGKR